MNALPAWRALSLLLGAFRRPCDRAAIWPIFLLQQQGRRLALGGPCAGYLPLSVVDFCGFEDDPLDPIIAALHRPRGLPSLRPICANDNPLRLRISSIRSSLGTQVVVGNAQLCPSHTHPAGVFVLLLIVTGPPSAAGLSRDLPWAFPGKKGVSPRTPVMEGWWGL
jgi:hypothetical protein